MRAQTDTTEENPKIGISACLLGENVRYDGGHKRDPFLTNTFGRYVNWIVVCPEFEVGMGVPREPVRLVGDWSDPRMVGAQSGADWTRKMKRFVATRVCALQAQSLSGFIVKKDSPSCGMGGVTVYGSAPTPSSRGRGLFAAALMDKWPLLPVEEEGRLRDSQVLENFIERVFAYQRWQAVQRRKSVGQLVDFHTRHKLLLLAHSEPHYRRLGRFLAAVKRLPANQAYQGYGRLFMAALAVHTTVKKHCNALEHIAGYFSKQLNADERQELKEAIGEFRRGVVPLAVPLTLARHYARKFRIEYLQQQIYLQPYSKELMLRNHA